MKDGFAVIDADRHSMEPAELWDRYLDPRFRGRVIAVGDVQLVDGRPFSSAHREQPNTGFRSWSHGERYRQVYADGAAHDFDPASNLRDMDREGVDVAVLFPTYGLHMIWLNDIDVDLGAAICRAYNTWIAEYCSNHADRLKGVALIPVYDPPQAIAELRRAKTELGLVGVMWRPNPLMGRNLDSPDYFPIYEAACDLDMPILVHEGAGSMLRQAGDERYGAFGRHIACHPMEQMLACLTMCANGLLERFPALRVAFMESGCGWLPFWLERMDEHWEHAELGSNRATKEPPSAIFKRQSFISCESGEALIQTVVDLHGDDNLVTATDYPHPDALDKFPERTIGDLTRNPTLSAESKRKILWDNPARLYGIKAAPGGGK